MLLLNGKKFVKLVDKMKKRFSFISDFISKTKHLGRASTHEKNNKQPIEILLPVNM